METGSNVEVGGWILAKVNGAIYMEVGEFICRVESVWKGGIRGI